MTTRSQQTGGEKKGEKNKTKPNQTTDWFATNDFPVK